MKQKILIGFLNKDIRGAIPAITSAFIEGLKPKYHFIPFYMDRRIKKKRTEFNIVNLYYFIKHYINWCLKIIKSRPDIAHFPVTSYWNLEKSLIFLATARVLGVKKVVGHLHGGAFGEFWQTLNPVRRKAALKVLSRLDAFVVLSEHWKKVAIDQIGLEESKVFEVNNPLVSRFENRFRDFRRDYGRSAATFISISGLAARKGILDALNALNGVKTPYRYNIVGGEIEDLFLNKVTAMIRDNNMTESVRILGEKYGEEKIELIRNSDIYLLPSHVENFPLAIIEAACAGMPIITTPVGALPEFFDHMENINYVEPANIDEIRRGIEFMLENPEERKRLGKAARRVFEEKLSTRMIMKQLDNVYQKISI
ncbi:MAG: glycosyltransferase [Candidatus Latescibacteria bacterium]|nr:glycosyltransferase [Candidatus Latescibacterota bacterium]